MSAVRRTLAALLISAVPAAAQQGPFDMTPEQTNAPKPAVVEPLPGVNPAAVAAPTEAAHQPGVLRYLLPSGDVVLTGENPARAWSFYLTAQEAATPASLNLGYQNAVVVAPEASWLRLSINGRKLIDGPIASTDKVSEIVVTPPPGLLRAGPNEIRFDSAQRHRTDCTVSSTYELWTAIKAERTFLSFAAKDAAVWKQVDDIRAIGVDAKGSTVFHLVVPGIGQAGATGPLMRLAQQLALMASMPNQSFSISDGTGPPQLRSSGAMTIVAGTAADLHGLIAKMPEGAEAGPIAQLTDNTPSGPGTLVLSGPTWDAVGKAIDAIVAPLDPLAGVQRSTIATAAWRTPDAPMLLSASRLALADLGVATQEFSGRRFWTDFAIGMPADFYANAYGEATLLIDAAYAADVLPGSHVDVYVNGDIAATVPITVSGGEIWRRLPIKVTMRHFRPGENTIGLEAVLMTDADSVCAPGATALPGARFALFDTSEFVMPDYARIGQTPNLAALGGTGSPYGGAEKPVAFVIDRGHLTDSSAAATLLARMAVAAGRVIAIDPAASVASASDGNGIFVGVISQIAPAILKQVGVAGTAPASWGASVVAAGGDAKPETVVTLDTWHDRVGGNGWRGSIQAMTDWLWQTFNMSAGTLRLLPGSDQDYAPDATASLLVAQQESPSGRGSWTLFTAPTSSALADGMVALTRQENWKQLAGHITTYDGATATVSAIPIGRAAFVVTQPASFFNIRLIVANWVSSNALSYAFLLAGLCLLLGLVTSGLLARLGRKP